MRGSGNRKEILLWKKKEEQCRNDRTGKKKYQKSCMTQEQVEQMKKRDRRSKSKKNKKKAVNSYMGRKIAASYDRWLCGVYRFAKYI